MQLIKLLKDIPAEGFAEGDVISVDEFSAASLIKREFAQEYTTPDGTPEGKPVRTIDDIVDPEVARNRAQMTATIVGGEDLLAQEAPDAQSAGGDADGDDE